MFCDGSICFSHDQPVASCKKDSKHFLIGPSDELWDKVLLVEHESVARFMAFAQDEAYLKYAGHRTASLDDSRLLPIVGGKI